MEKNILEANMKQNQEAKIGKKILGADMKKVKFTDTIEGEADESDEFDDNSFDDDSEDDKFNSESEDSIGQMRMMRPPKMMPGTISHNQMGMPSVQFQAGPGSSMLNDVNAAAASATLNDLDAAIAHRRMMSMRMYSPMSGMIPVNQGGGMLGITRNFLAQNVNKVYRSVPTRYGDQSRQAPTIHKVPMELERCADDGWGARDYRPVAVHIGGFDHLTSNRDKSKLEGYKWRCVSQLISRNKKHMEPAKTTVLLHECSERLQLVLPRIRDSYGQGTGLSDYGMVQTMLPDGCFILHRLLKFASLAANGQFKDEDDDWTQVHGWCWVWQSATRDLLLLENQIPFFVLRQLFQEMRNDDEPEELLITGSLRLFQSLRPQMLHSSPIDINDVHHLLHLFYLSIGFPLAPAPSPPPNGAGNDAAHVFLPELPQWVPCAKELEEAGVRFRRRKHKDATSFLDIKFDPRRGTLEIPPLQLYDSSSSLFRNLIAFEQAYPGTRCDISTYAVFMDCLIKTPEDMRILHLHGILVNQMNGQQDATHFFSTICAQVHYPTDNYLVGLMRDVNKYKERRRHKWRAALVRNYFGNPWIAISVVAAVLLLAMTVLQTFFTVYPYFKPSD